MDFIDLTIGTINPLTGLRRWEDTVPFMYLDSRKLNGVPAPLVTAGIGCAFGPACASDVPQEVLGLPWTIGGSAASSAQIQADYAAICKAPSGFAAAHYALYTRIRLSDDAIMTLCKSRLAEFVAVLRATFPAFDSWPETCKAGALDLIYGVGPGGFQKYHQFKSACLSGAWADAADRCASDVSDHAYDLRNAARKQLFLDGVTPDPVPDSVIDAVVDESGLA